MFRSHSRIAALALGACALVGHAVAVAVVEPITAVCRFVGRHFKEACALAAVKQDDRPMVALRVKAVGFAKTLAKRERPKLSPTWRMCPST